MATVAEAMAAAGRARNEEGTAAVGVAAAAGRDLAVPRAALAAAAVVAVDRSAAR